MNEPLDAFDSAPDVLAGTDAALDDLAYLVGQRLASMGARIVTAESCTGGGIARALTERGGASVWFDRGFVTYSNQAKQDLLGVPGKLLDQYGAVSEQVAGAMAMGALQTLGPSQTALAKAEATRSIPPPVHDSAVTIRAPIEARRWPTK